MRKGFGATVCILSAVVLIGFFPIRTVGKLRNNGEYTELDCTYMSDGNFYADSKLNDIDGFFGNEGEPFECVVDIDNNNPLDVLRKADFDCRYFKESDTQKRVPLNRFYLYGNVTQTAAENGMYRITFDVNEWSFYNSVNRLSFRRYFVPNDWITLLDFDVFALIKRFFE